MKLSLLGLLLWFAVGVQAQVGPTVPAQESPGIHRAGPSSVDVGDYIYISGQGPRGADGALPATFAAQVRQALNSLKSVVETAGLTIDHVVYTTVYLTDISQYGEMNSVFAGYFGRLRPLVLCSELRGFRIPLLRLMQSWCAVSPTGGQSIRRTTSQTSLFLRAFSLTIACSFPPCQLTSLAVARFRTIQRLRWTSRSTA